MFTYRRQQNCPVLILFNTPLTFIPILHKTAYSPVYTPINAIYFIKIPVICLFFAFFVCNISNMFTYFACNFLILYIVIYKQLCYNKTIINKGVFNMQVSKYLYKHFAQLNCHNLNYGVKITSAVLLQYVKALGFRVLKLKFYGKPKRNNFSITVKHHNYNNCYCLNWRTNKNGYIVFVGVCIV